MQVGIYQNRTMHTEIIGTFIELLLDKGHNIIVYNNFINHRSNFIKYYKSLFNNKFIVKGCNHILQDFKKLKLLIICTSNDNIPKKIMNDNKLLYIVHMSKNARPKIKRKIALSPNVYKNNYILPIYKQNRNYNLVKKNIFGIVGGINHNRNVTDIIKIARKYKNINIWVFTHGGNLNKIRKFKNIKIFKNINTINMINRLKQCKFILPLVKKGGAYHRDRLTGTIPLAINLNKPMLIDRITNNIYKLDGNIIYRNSIMEVMQKAIRMNRMEQRNLIERVIKMKNRKAEENKKKFNIL